MMIVLVFLPEHDHCLVQDCVYFFVLESFNALLQLLVDKERQVFRTFGVEINEEFKVGRDHLFEYAVISQRLDQKPVELVLKPNVNKLSSNGNGTFKSSNAWINSTADFFAFSSTTALPCSRKYFDAALRNSIVPWAKKKRNKRFSLLRCPPSRCEIKSCTLSEGRRFFRSKNVSQTGSFASRLPLACRQRPNFPFRQFASDAFESTLLR